MTCLRADSATCRSRPLPEDLWCDGCKESAGRHPSAALVAANPLARRTTLPGLGPATCGWNLSVNVQVLPAAMIVPRHRLLSTYGPV